MQISCKCLNFIASSNSQASGGAAVGTAATAATADAVPTPASVGTQPAGASHADDDCSMSAGYVGINASSNLPAALMHAFLQKYPRNFIFYSQCMDFFKQSVGPVSDLTINAVNQRDLIYSLTLDVLQAQTPQSWQLSICINCNVALCAKRLQPTTSGFATAANHPPQFLINCSLLMNNEEWAHRRAEKSFSDTFGLLIMDHPQLDAQQQQQSSATAPTTPISFTVGSLSNAPNLALDSKQQRLRQLQQHLQQRLKREIAETDERILRYTEQQFALLKSFREKAEQECALLVRLIQRVPEQQAAELLDRVPPALEVTGSVGYAARRRNTIGSWRDMNATTPATPTTPNPTTTAGMLTLPLAGVAATATTSAMDTNTQGATVLATTIVGSSGANRKLSNFDTPPATPEATPMSVGNSPTFRQQQLTQPFVRIASNSFQQQFPTPSSDPGDDCLFELEGVDSGGAPPTSYNALVSNITLKLPYQQQQQQHYPRTFTSHHHHHHHHEKNMSDLDESDDAEEAEVALDLDSSMPIPMRNRAMANDRRATVAAAAAAATVDMMNFAKSLPIEIANSPMASRSYIGESDDDELDNNVDIAASIKALAKSVHGEAVFGDLPRPRLRSQI